MRLTQLAKTAPAPTNATAVLRRAAVTRADAALNGSAPAASSDRTDSTI